MKICFKDALRAWAGKPATPDCKDCRELNADVGATARRRLAVAVALEAGNLARAEQIRTGAFAV